MTRDPLTGDSTDREAARRLADELRRWPKFGDGPGLERMSGALERMSRRPSFRDWSGELDAIKITGSNGKGATATLLAALLTEIGVRTGLYTSPHLRRPSERVRIDGREVSHPRLLEAWRASRELTGEGAGAFERMTLAALDVFAEEDADTVVAEAGIGGRLDPTRVIPGRLAAITSVDLEHTQLLGKTLEEIALDKAELCPDGGTLVLGADIDGELLESLRSSARERRVDIVAVSEQARLRDLRVEGPTMRFDMELHGVHDPATQQDSDSPSPATLDRVRGRGDWEVSAATMAMAGRHQWSNAVVALLLAKAWLAKNRPTIGARKLTDAWRRLIQHTALPGRFERVARRPDVFIDHCHTPKAAAAVAEIARTLRGVVLVIGVSGDKDVEAVARPLLAVADVAVLTRAHHRGGDPAELERIVRQGFPALEHRRIDSLPDALDEARRLASERGLSVLVAGGLFLGVEAAEILEGRDLELLQFF